MKGSIIYQLIAIGIWLMVIFFNSEGVDMVVPYGVADGNARLAREL